MVFPCPLPKAKSLTRTSLFFKEEPVRLTYWNILGLGVGTSEGIETDEPGGVKLLVSERLELYLSMTSKYT